MMLTLRTYHDDLLPEIVDLWNRGAATAHGFHPLTAEVFYEQVIATRRFFPARLLVAAYRETVVGWVHYDLVDQYPYPSAGVIAAIVIHPDYRQRGFAKELLDAAINQLERAGVTLIDALGAWPYSSFYAGLIDGSERAGVDEKDAAMLGLFDQAQFMRGRTSYIMRCALSAAPLPTGAAVIAPSIYHGARAEQDSWLDFCFRYFDAYDHILTQANGEALSHAIYARMRGYADYCGREIYALYGVNTPEPYQRQGYAAQNLSYLQTELAARGAQEIEVHVYQDNPAALKLYRRLGFHEIGATVMMRRR